MKQREMVLCREEDGVGIVSLNRPDKHNAVSDALRAELRAGLEWAIAAADVRCILIRGEGRSFCSGRDTSELGHRATGDSDFSYIQRAQGVRFAMLDTSKPIVAALRGHVIGVGMELALGADMRLATRDVSLRLPEIRFGLVPDTGGTQLLTALVGPSKAKYMVMTGEPVDAEQALQWGIVDWLVESDQLDAAAFDLARRLAGGPPLAIAMAKQLVDQLWADSVRRGIRSELLAQTTLFSTSDYREARTARQEGREPRYTGS